MLGVVVAVAIAGGGCQTKRQAITAAVIGTGVAAIGGYGMYEERNDDGGPAPVFPVMVLVGGLTAIFSAINAIAIDD